MLKDVVQAFNLEEGFFMEYLQVALCGYLL